jgi:hypothetical protein
MSVQYEVTAITGKYTDAQGNEKNRYAKLGVVIDGKNGPVLKLETIPLGWDGFAYLNEPRARDQTATRQPKQQASGAGFEDDDLPF